MSDIAIRVENLSKQYRIGSLQPRYKTLRGWLAEAAQTPVRRLSNVVRGKSALSADETIWALKDVSFEVKRGEVVGVIGRNGAGKTTLLKILSRITEPTGGRARIRGRVGSLLEVGTGFHPELTGRENTYLNGAILGMKRAEIERRFDEIVAFAEIEKFIDTPVKHYSSGMRVRLAFAVAAHLEPEILLVDEVLAVGDVEFQRKCLGKMGDVAGEGRTVLFVSHNMGAVHDLCHRCFWVEQGRLRLDGKETHVVSSYLESMNRKVRPFYRRDNTNIGLGSDKVRLLEAGVANSEGRQNKNIRYREPFSIHLAWENESDIPGTSYAIRFHDADMRLLSAVNTLSAQLDLEDVGIHRVSCRFDHNVLVPGDYYITVGAYVRPNTTLQLVDPCLKLTISEIPFPGTSRYSIMGKPAFAMQSSWEIW